MPPPADVPRPVPAAALSRAARRPAAGRALGVTDAAVKSHVMVVEDDRDTREVLRLILEMEGIEVTEASDGIEALDRLHELREADPDRPCAIVLDIMMPRCSGPEFRRRQLHDPLIAGVPIIVLSAIADQVKLDELEAFAKVSKPFDPDQLIQVVRRACGIPHD
jgi:CheY-like chemotaxis protein